MDIKNFFINNDNDWEVCGDGVRRKILAHNDNLMIVEVEFEEGAVGELHSHSHEQISYVIEGEFEFNIGGEKKILKKGDSTFKQANIEHGGIAFKKSRLLDIFTPMRKDFLK